MNNVQSAMNDANLTRDLLPVSGPPISAACPRRIRNSLHSLFIANTASSNNISGSYTSVSGLPLYSSRYAFKLILQSSIPCISS